MKVIIASTMVPFIEGGATFFVEWLEKTLLQHGHTVETLLFPYYGHYPTIFDQMLALRLLDLHDTADRLITIRTPSYLLRHPNKIIWFIHHHRAAYDLWGTPYQDIPHTPAGLRYRDAIFESDELAFREARKIFTNSRTTGERLRSFNNVESEVLYPPLFQPERYSCGEYGDSVLYVSRLTKHKRQDLAIRSMPFVRSGAKLIIAGAPDRPGGEQELYALARSLHVEDRVTILSSWISEEKKIELFRDCLAALYFPLDEDSYGYPSLEAHHSGKCVITTTDSGGTLELIADRENGFVTEPEPQAIAGAIDRLYQDRQLARRLGEGGRQKIESLGIRWDRVVERLLQ